MVDINLAEIKEVRKRRLLVELIRNTETCCIFWNKTIEPTQYRSDKDQYDFLITRLPSSIQLDVYKDCARLNSYSSNTYDDVTTLYETIVGIQNRNYRNNIQETIIAFQNLPRVCGIVFTEYAHGGVVCGGEAEEEWINAKTQGGVVTGGHAPYNGFEFPEGGVVVGGEAHVQPYLEFPEGGVVVGGNSPTSFQLLAKGGAVVGGSALFLTDFPTSGGISVSGSATVEDAFVAQGGSVAGGAAIVEVI